MKVETNAVHIMSGGPGAWTNCYCIAVDAHIAAYHRAAGQVGSSSTTRNIAICEAMCPCRRTQAVTIGVLPRSQTPGGRNASPSILSRGMLYYGQPALRVHAKISHHSEYLLKCRMYHTVALNDR